MTNLLFLLGFVIALWFFLLDIAYLVGDITSTVEEAINDD